jgi:hypothetical protein
LARRVLFRNQETRRLEKKTLQIIIFQRRLFVQLDDRRFFFVTVIFVPATSGMMCCRISRKLS